MFLLHQSKALDKCIPTVSWLTFGSKYWPQTSKSPIVNLLLQAASVFAVPHKNVQRPQPTLPGTETIQLLNSLNSLFVWFQCCVWSADGAVLWQHNTMSNRHKKGCIGGLFAPPISTFWCCRSKKTLCTCTVLIWCCGECTTSIILVAAFAAVAKMSVQWFGDALCTKYPHRYY